MHFYAPPFAKATHTGVSATKLLFSTLLVLLKTV